MATPYELSTAPSGLTILKVPRAGTEAVTVSLLYRAGSRYETPQTNGIAHFNEHMVFKGGQKFPTFHEVTQAFDSVGAVNNAFTGAEVTGFWAKVKSDHVPQVLDVISDVLTQTAYDPAELDRERGVIVEEINMYEDDPASKIYEVLEAASFPNHPLGRSTLGPKENIRRFTPDDFRAYAKVHQTADRAVLVLAGKVDDLDQAKLDEYAARFEGTSDVEPEAFAIEQTEPTLKIYEKQTEQSHLGLALRGPALRDRDDAVKLRVLAQLLGGSMSSRLFIEVREKRGLAYYVRSTPDLYTDTGALVITAGVTKEKAPDALSAILNELQRLKDGDLKDEELRMHKDSLMGRMTLRWEDSMALADFYGEQQLLLGDIWTTDQALEKIEAVGVQDLVGLSGSIVGQSKLTAALIGPHRDSEFEGKLTLN